MGTKRPQNAPYTHPLYHRDCTQLFKGNWAALIMWDNKSGRIDYRSRQEGEPVPLFLPPIHRVIEQDMTLSKKTTKLETHLKELFYNLAEPLRDNPAMWEKILPTPEEYAESVIESKRERIQNSSPKERDALLQSLVIGALLFYRMLKRKLPSCSKLRSNYIFWEKNTV